MTMRAFAADLQTAAMHRAQFIANVLSITGDTRLFWLPSASDTTTATSVDLNGRTITWDATVASRLSALGLGYAQSFNGSTHFGTVPDADDLSFGDGSSDSAFTLLALANITDTAATKSIASKYTTQREYLLNLTSSETVVFGIYDESVDVQPQTVSDAGVGTGAWKMIAAGYSAASGGATAANDMSVYVDGQVVAVTPSNNVSYVAMENGNRLFAIGSSSHAAAVTPFAGSMAMLILCQKSLTASEHFLLKEHINAYFGLSL